MFTGIIEEVGVVKQIKQGARSAVITIGARRVMEDIHLGDSIAMNGVCLTVTSFDKNSYSVDVMHETLRRTNLGELKSGSRVNLERAMARTAVSAVISWRDTLTIREGSLPWRRMITPSGSRCRRHRPSFGTSWKKVPSP